MTVCHRGTWRWGAEWQRCRGVVRFEGVGMRYGAGPEILRDITVRFEPGSFHFLTGPSGAGKTSLLKLMYLAERASAGTIHLFDRDVGTMSRDERAAVRRQIGVIFRDFRLLDHLTAFDNVVLPLRIFGENEERARTFGSELLRWVGLAEDLDTRPPALSDGQKQRVAIARAVITRPRLLLADEPTGNVDAKQGIRLTHLFQELNRIGTTVVLATHDEAWIERTGHPVLRLNAGRLVPPPAQAEA
ncbi:MAG: ATP-binding cassette domain-containing protein [Alphaproteobacteria bacterium]|nr:ATP-binding cassette domain-containing protein [Alphaproteobacteria bacterium]